MAETTRGLVTRILKAAGAGEPSAADDLLALVYDELRSLARALMVRIPPGNTLQPTALVHEAYLRLVGRGDPGWDGRRHFFAAAAEAMRRILVEQARRKARQKRGGGYKRVSVEDVDLPIATPSDDMLALDEALEYLRERHPRHAKIVMLRYFAGLTIEETAKVMDVSESTVGRDWRFARALLYQRLTTSEPSEED